MEKPDFETEAARIMSAAGTANVTLKLLGALAVRSHSKTARKLAQVRELSDIDFFSISKQRDEIIKLFTGLGYSEAQQFNFTHYPRALKFYDALGRHVDIWLDKFEMCHTFDFAKSMKTNGNVLSVEDLLLTKLQIVELEKKDITDVFCLVNDYELGKGNGQLDSEYIVGLCRNDWGIYKTFSTNIRKILDLLDAQIPDFTFEDEDRNAVRSRLSRLLDGIEKAPKTLQWKLRARIGEKKVWYELPTLRE